jgi:hypothetical protein
VFTCPKLRLFINTLAAKLWSVSGGIVSALPAHDSILVCRYLHRIATERLRDVSRQPAYFPISQLLQYPQSANLDTSTTRRPTNGHRTIAMHQCSVHLRHFTWTEAVDGTFLQSRLTSFLRSFPTKHLRILATVLYLRFKQAVKFNLTDCGFRRFYRWIPVNKLTLVVSRSVTHDQALLNWNEFL